MDYGTKLRNLLKEKNLTINELANISGLRIETIKNILYGKSSKYNYIKQISDALNIPNEYFTEEYNLTINTEQFYSAILIVHNILNELQINHCSKNCLYKLYEKAYKLFSANKFNTQECSMYMKGVIENLIEQNLINKIFVAPH